MVVDPQRAANQKALIAERARRFAVQHVAEEEARASFTPTDSFSLAELIALDLPELEWSIDGLHARGMNALLAAQYKTGKTTMMANLARALADGDAFLGHDTHAPPGRIAFWNYEMGDRMMQAWITDLDIENPDRIEVLNLRGRRVPLYSPYVQQWTAEWLAEHEIDSWIIDPAVKAMSGWPTDNAENANSAVGMFLDVLDNIKEEAGVKDLYVAHHTGRVQMEQGQERSRGATRWDDWPDVRWILVKDKNNARFFYADGRDVVVDECKLEYDEESRLLVVSDGENRQTNQAMDDAFRVIEAVNSIGDGHTKAAVKDAIKGIARERKHPAIQLAEELKFITVVCATKGTGLLVNLNQDHPSVKLALAGGQRGDIHVEGFDDDNTD